MAALQAQLNALQGEVKAIREEAAARHGGVTSAVQELSTQVKFCLAASAVLGEQVCNMPLNAFVGETEEAVGRLASGK